MPPTPSQPHHNATFSGPPIHPKPKSHHRLSRRSGSGSGSNCNPLTCCCSCICNCICNCIINLICQTLITISIFISIIGLLLWFIFRPNIPKFHVDDATMTQFTLSPTNNTLYYNLIINMTFRNPNRRLGIYYDQIDATVMYHDQRFSTVDVEGFYLGHKEENGVNVVFKGDQLVAIGGDRSEYESEKSDGVYRIDLKVRLKIRLKVLWVKTPKLKPKLDCDLKVPLSSKGKNSTVKFERTKCDFDWWGRRR